MLLKIFKTGKLIFREIEKEILLKGVNNNNNNEVNNSIIIIRKNMKD